MLALFNLLESSPLRGTSAAYLVLLTAALLTLFSEWRITLPVLAAQYLFAGLLFIEVVQAPLALANVVVGLFVCLVLLVTAVQLRYGRSGAGLLPGAAQPERTIQLGALAVPWETAVRLLAALVALLLTVLLAPRVALPGVPPDLSHLNLAIVALGLFGLAGMLVGRAPLPVGVSLFTFLTGFTLFLTGLRPSIALLAGLALLTLLIALAIAYLMQAQRERGRVPKA